MSFKECIREKVGSDPELSRVRSLVLFGSYVRGDFVQGLSDLDILAIVEEEPPDLERLKECITACAQGIDYKLIDLPWERLENLRDPVNMGYGFKFLTIYLRDFLANHEVIYGEEIAHLLPRYDMGELVRWRAERLSKSEALIRDRPEMAPIVAGEVCRLLAVMNGAEDISKGAIMESLRTVGDEGAIEIYESYVKGVKPDKGQDYYEKFIESRISGIESILRQRKVMEEARSTS